MNTTLSIDDPHDQLAGTRWELDPSGSTAEFHVPNLWGLVKVHGRFAGLDGQLEVDEHGARRLHLKIDASSLDTGNRRRDRHLKSADFFDADGHPEVDFRSTRISDAPGGGLRVEGELRAGAGRVGIELAPTTRRTGDDIEIEAETTVDQRLLGMTASPLGMIRTPATLTVRARLRRVA
ncbi:MAG TPA: YceI family protein [Solirubrobacteraceae bacterium]